MGAQINQLPTAQTITSSDLQAIYQSSNGDARKVSIGQMLSYYTKAFVNPAYPPQISTPSDGFNLVMEESSISSWFLMRPITGITTGTIVLPSSDVTVDGQEIIFSSTQQIATLTINGNGQVVNGAPSSLGADNTFRLRFEQQTKEWYKV